METLGPMERLFTALGLLPVIAPVCMCTHIIISTLDHSQNSHRATCNIVSLSAGSIFSINSTTGVVTVTGVVNFEMGQEYELSVEARDRGNPQRSSVVDLHVQVINAEDESPRFPISFYTAEISEGK